MQRPAAKELLKHPFIRRAKKTAYLSELIDKFKRWKAEKGPDSDSDDSAEYVSINKMKKLIFV